MPPTGSAKASPTVDETVVYRDAQGVPVDAISHPERLASSSPQSLMALTGTKTWVLLRCAYQTPWRGGSTSDNYPKQNNDAYFNNLFLHANYTFSSTPSNTSLGLREYWQKTSYNNIDISLNIPAGGWKPMPQANSAYGTPNGTGSPTITASFDTLAHDCAQAWAGSIVLNASTNFYAFTLDDAVGACGVGGTFNLGGGGEVDNVDWAGGTLIGSCQDDMGLWAHEMGHAFGLQHSEGGDGGLYNTAYDALSAPCGNDGAYWGGTVVLNAQAAWRFGGYGCLPSNLLAYHKADVLGWIAANRIYTAPPGTTQITLERTGAPQSTTNYLMARIPINGTSYYTVEARMKTGFSTGFVTPGYDENIPGSYYNPAEPSYSTPVGMVVINRIFTDALGKHIRLVGTDNSGEGWWDDAGTQWTPGETFNPGGGITVQVLSQGATSFSVSITRPGGVTPPPSPTYKPDGRIRKGSGSLVGDNIYNTTGLNQSRSGTRKPGTITFTISGQNDGNAADRFKVSAAGLSATGFTITFFAGTTNITAAVLAGTYQTASIGPGGTFAIKAKVTITKAAARGASISRLVTLTSVADSSKLDVVQFIGKRK